eukprot:12855242-Prorocentrum_lima.AAC.1
MDDNNQSYEDDEFEPITSPTDPLYKKNTQNNEQQDNGDDEEENSLSQAQQKINHLEKSAQDLENWLEDM